MRHLALPQLMLLSASAYNLTGNISSVHDPSGIVRGDDGRYYVFSTSYAPELGIQVRWSLDAKHWEWQGYAFQTQPSWIRTLVPENDGSLWAPDVHKHGSGVLLTDCAAR